MPPVASKSCPDCQTALQPRRLGEVELDECPRCRGIWCEAGELGKLKDAADPDLRWLDFELWKHPELFRVAPRPENCPRCLRSMVAVDYARTGVEVHCCTGCRGVWIARGALQKLIAALRDELDRMTASDYVRHTLQEAKEIVVGDEGFVSEWRDFLSVMRLLELRLFVEHPGLLKLIMGAQRSSPLR